MRQRIDVDRLLLQRETAYAHVYAIEREINALLGDTYPFPPPPVEVAGKPARKQAKKKAASKAKSTPVRLRPLMEHETAYRLRIQHGEHVVDESHDDRKAIEGLLASPSGEASVLSVEAIGTDGAATEQLYTSPPKDNDSQ